MYEYSIQSQNHTVSPSAVSNQKSYYTSEYSIKTKILLYVQVQYKINNHTVRPSAV